jgi:hypothetical protein
MGFYIQMFAKEDKAERAVPVKIAQAVCLAWLSFLELVQMWKTRLYYIQDVWNYITAGSILLSCLTVYKSQEQLVAIETQNEQ